jgi:hypothetical protein
MSGVNLKKELCSKLFTEYDVDVTKENLKIMKTILKNWNKLLDVKKEADFWVHAVSCADVEQKHRKEENETIKDCCDDLDGISLYSGDTECEHTDVLKNFVCQLFHDKDTGDRRYRNFCNQMPEPESPRSESA